MAIIRNKNRPIPVENEVIRNPRLSVAAKGLYTRLLLNERDSDDSEIRKLTREYSKEIQELVGFGYLEMEDDSNSLKHLNKKEILIFNHILNEGKKNQEEKNPKFFRPGRWWMSQTYAQMSDAVGLPREEVVEIIHEIYQSYDSYRHYFHHDKSYLRKIGPWGFFDWHGSQLKLFFCVNDGKEPQ